MIFIIMQYLTFMIFQCNILCECVKLIKILLGLCMYLTLTPPTQFSECYSKKFRSNLMQKKKKKNNLYRTEQIICFAKTKTESKILLLKKIIFKGKSLINLSSYIMYTFLLFFFCKTDKNILIFSSITTKKLLFTKHFFCYTSRWVNIFTLQV